MAWPRSGTCLRRGAASSGSTGLRKGLLGFQPCDVIVKRTNPLALVGCLRLQWVALDSSRLNRLASRYLVALCSRPATDRLRKSEGLLNPLGLSVVC